MKIAPWLVVLAAVTVSVGAEAAIPDFTLEAYRGPNKMPLVGVVARAPAKHHFNLKAPMSAKTVGSSIDLAATTLMEREIRFEVENPSIAAQDSVTVAAYLCDDAKTYCVKKTSTVALASAGAPPAPGAAEPARNRVVREVELPNAKPGKAEASPSAAPSVAPSASPSGSPAAAAAAPVVVPPLTVKKKVARDEHGFWNDVETAQEQARKTGKPLMIDFFGIWCPPCNLFNEEVFPTAAFKAQAKNFVLLKVDADQIESWPIKSRFKVGGYPTILFATPELDEISRVVGFSPVSDFIPKMREAYANRKTSFVDRVLAHRSRYLEGLKALIEVKYEQKEYKEAMKYVQEALLLKPDEPFFRLAQMEIRSVDDPRTLKEAANIAFIKELWSQRKIANTTDLFWMETMMGEETSQYTPEQLMWAVDVVDELKTRVNERTLHLEGREVSIGDLDAARVSFYEAAKKGPQTKQAVQDTIASYKRLMKLFDGEKSRGLNLELAYWLGYNGQVAEATAIYEDFIKRYPEEFTYYYAAARHYQEVAKDLKRAREVADLAVKYSYGDNLLRAMTRLVNVRAAQGEAKPAIEQARQVLARVPKFDGLTVRTGRYVAALEKAIEAAGGKK